MQRCLSQVLCRRREGWALPFQGRVRLARMLLGALFTAGDSTPLAESGMGLPALLGRAVWPALGVSPRTHACLMAWVHFVECVRHPGARLSLTGLCVLATTDL